MEFSELKCFPVKIYKDPVGGLALTSLRVWRGVVFGKKQVVKPKLKAQRKCSNQLYKAPQISRKTKDFDFTVLGSCLNYEHENSGMWTMSFLLGLTNET